MKIQAINNQNNINHKAYFKPNAEFMKLYKNAKKTEKLADAANFFKEKVPNHELEILGVLKNPKILGLAVYEIANNITQKKEKVLINNEEEGLMQILSRFNLYRDSDFFKLEDKKTDIDCLDILTKKD